MPERFESTIEHQKMYWEKIRELEIELFPEFKNEDFAIDSPETNNFYYAPHRHFLKDLFSETDVINFRENKKLKMLSVGAGPAYLERILVSLGISKDNIVLADREPRDLPTGFKTKIFDMLEEWPKFEDDQKFDLIIFPENPAINVRYNGTEYKVPAFVSLFVRALEHLKPEGEIRITGNPNSLETTKMVQQTLRDLGYDVIVSNFRETRESLVTVTRNPNK